MSIFCCCRKAGESSRIEVCNTLLRDRGAQDKRRCLRNRGDVHERSGLLIKRFLHCKLPEAVSFDLTREQSFEELTNDIYWKNRSFYC